MERKIIRDNNGRFMNGSNSSGMLGKKFSKDSKMKIAEKMKGKHNSSMTEIKKGIHISSNTEFKKGMAPWNKGKKYSPWNKGKQCPQLSGENNPFWKGGLSFEPYPITFNNKFKELIRQRDNFTCLKCNLFEADAKKLYNQKLHVHHIDYNKSLTIPENCCALCMRCNVEVNSNRSHWTKFFQGLLSEKYGYEYSESGEIILNISKEVNQHE